ncbi:MAG: 2-oxo-4-hydroxy-4-carboxy-5-ureidoimidazoline decarboxylase [Caulobacteraceae bacterium]
MSLASLPDLTGRPVEASDRASFQRVYGHLFEHSPWVVDRAWAQRPFADAAALHAAFIQVIEAADVAERLNLVRAHPKLADKAAVAAGLTASSAAEQSSAGLDRLTCEEYRAFQALNTAYDGRFGFPFIICVRLHDKAGILAALRARLIGAPDEELAEALLQIGLISRLRLADVRLAEEAPR